MPFDAICNAEITECVSSFLYADEEMLWSSLFYLIWEIQFQRRRDTLALFHSLYDAQAEAAYDAAISAEVGQLVLSQSIPDWPSDSD